MAQVVKSFDFTSRPSGRQKYPWQQWTNGQIWALKSSHPTVCESPTGKEDFAITPASFANNAASYGKRHEGIKTVNIAVDGDTVYLQAVLLPVVEAEDDEDSEDA